jgi:hypothetical protein
MTWDFKEVLRDFSSRLRKVVQGDCSNCRYEETDQRAWPCDGCIGENWAPKVVLTEARIAAFNDARMKEIDWPADDLRHRSMMLSALGWWERPEGVN